MWLRGSALNNQAATNSKAASTITTKLTSLKNDKKIFGIVCPNSSTIKWEIDTNTIPGIIIVLIILWNKISHNTILMKFAFNIIEVIFIFIVLNDSFIEAPGVLNDIHSQFT